MKKILKLYAVFLALVSLFFVAIYFQNIDGLVYERRDISSEYANCINEDGVDTCEYSMDSISEIIPEKCESYFTGDGRLCGDEGCRPYDYNDIKAEFDRPKCADRYLVFESVVSDFYLYAFYFFILLVICGFAKYIYDLEDE